MEVFFHVGSLPAPDLGVVVLVEGEPPHLRAAYLWAGGLVLENWLPLESVHQKWHIHPHLSRLLQVILQILTVLFRCKGFPTTLLIVTLIVQTNPKPIHIHPLQTARQKSEVIIRWSTPCRNDNKFKVQFGFKGILGILQILGYGGILEIAVPHDDTAEYRGLNALIVGCGLVQGCVEGEDAAGLEQKSE